MNSAAKAMSGTVALSGRNVTYVIRRSATSVRRRIRISPTGVEVVVPKGGDLDSAARFLLENERWVLDQLAFVERASGIRNQRLSVESLLLHGVEHGLEIAEEQTTRNYGIVAQRASTITVRVPMRRHAVAPRALELWLRRLARRRLNEVLGRRAAEMGLRYDRLYIMNQRTRWGGCSARRNLSFNWRLVMAPPEVLDYIAVHELAHLVESKHSTKFWLTVRCYCPEYERCRRWLRENEWRMRLSIA